MQIVSLLNSIQDLTSRRERAALELSVAEAIADLLRCERLEMLKLSQSGDESFVWSAVVVDDTGAELLDDGVSIPDEMVSIERRPDLMVCLQTLAPRISATGIVLPLIRPAGGCFGFVELAGQGFSTAQVDIAGRLLAIFMNVVAMLDYSEIDTLTGLLNRKTFDDHLMRILASLAVGNDDRVDAVRLPRRRKPVQEGACHWLAVMDIDHFKRVNDTYGHMIGDEVLLLVATMMKSGFRSHDKLFRFGGEEFVVVLKPNREADAQRIFDRFRHAIEKRDFPQVGRVTISIGYTPIRLGDQPSVVLDTADSALYWAKEHGRNQVASYPDLLARGELETKDTGSDIELF